MTKKRNPKMIFKLNYDNSINVILFEFNLMKFKSSKSLIRLQFLMKSYLVPHSIMLLTLKT